MKLRLLMFCLILALPFAASAQRRRTVKYTKLPPNVTLKTEVWGKMVPIGDGRVAPERTTVEKRLRELKATYKKNILVDGKGREIKFLEPTCRGVSAGQDEDAADQKSRAEELAKLKLKFTVIEQVCDPAKVSFEILKPRFRPETRGMTLGTLL